MKDANQYVHCDKFLFKTKKTHNSFGHILTDLVQKTDDQIDFSCFLSLCIPFFFHISLLYVSRYVSVKSIARISNQFTDVLFFCCFFFSSFIFLFPLFSIILQCSSEFLVNDIISHSILRYFHGILVETKHSNYDTFN